MDESREAGVLSAKLDESWARRVKEAENWNTQLANGTVTPGYLRRVVWSVQAARSGRNYAKRRTSLEKNWRENSGRKHASLAWALNDTFGISFWAGGLFKVGFHLAAIDNRAYHLPGSGGWGYRAAHGTDSHEGT